MLDCDYETQAGINSSVQAAISEFVKYTIESNEWEFGGHDTPSYMFSDNPMGELVGKFITRIYVSDGEHALLFCHGGGEFSAYETVWDCCSEAWFADIEGVEALLGATVTCVEGIEIEVMQDDRCRQNEDKFYDVKLTTTKGIATIVYRNSSNGCYGGSCELIERGSWREIKAIVECNTRITEDWRA